MRNGGVSMVSNNHRQAIADALRQKAAYYSGVSLAEWWCVLQELVTGEVDFPDAQETFLALADLVDPGGDEGDADE